MNGSRGFSLLELLVVLLIVGLLSGLSVAWLNAGRSAALQALDGLAAQVQLHAAQARHSGQLLGLRWNGRQPEFVRLEQQLWVADPWRPVAWPTELRADWPAGTVPPVIFTPDGVVAPRLKWQWSDGQQHWHWLSDGRLARAEVP